MEWQQSEKLLVSESTRESKGKSLSAIVRTHAQGPPLQEHTTHAKGKGHQSVQYRTNDVRFTL